MSKRKSTPVAEPAVDTTLPVNSEPQTTSPEDTTALAKMFDDGIAALEKEFPDTHYTAGKYYPWLYLKDKLSLAWAKFKRSLPRIVWYGQEVDVLITFTREKFPKLDLLQEYYKGVLPEPGMEIFPEEKAAGYTIQPQFLPDGVGSASLALGRSDITFDTGFGPRGRDWYFDYSLSGPVRVKFIGHAKRPLARRD